MNQSDFPPSAFGGANIAGQPNPFMDPENPDWNLHNLSEQGNLTPSNPLYNFPPGLQDEASDYRAPARPLHQGFLPPQHTLYNPSPSQTDRRSEVSPGPKFEPSQSPISPYDEEVRPQGSTIDPRELLCPGPPNLSISPSSTKLSPSEQRASINYESPYGDPVVGSSSTIPGPKASASKKSGSPSSADPSKGTEFEAKNEDPTMGTSKSTAPKPTQQRRGRKQDPNVAQNPEYKFPCPHLKCPRRFKRQEHLERHDRSVHQKVENFECTECGIKFSRSDNLAQHKKTHRQEPMSKQPIKEEGSGT